jgi:hypothetical protein
VQYVVNGVKPPPGGGKFCKVFDTISLSTERDVFKFAVLLQWQQRIKHQESSQSRTECAASVNMSPIIEESDLIEDDGLNLDFVASSIVESTSLDRNVDEFSVWFDSLFVVVSLSRCPGDPLASMHSCCPRGEAGALWSGVLLVVLEQPVLDVLILERPSLVHCNRSHCEPVSCPATRDSSS